MGDEEDFTRRARPEPTPVRGLRRKPARTPPSAGSVSLPAEALQALEALLAESLGTDQADDLLFRVGRAWARSEAPLLERDGESPHDLVVRGLARLATCGLGGVTLESFELGPAEFDFLLRGRVKDPAGSRSSDVASSRPGGSLCSLTTGFIAGLAGAATGLDVVCSPFHCSAPGSAPGSEQGRGVCGRGCGFELVAGRHAQRAAERPAPAATGSPTASEAPSGAARFFLDSVGGAFGEHDISFADVVENTEDAIILIDCKHIVRFWSAGAERMFGYGRDEVVGRPVGLIVPADLMESGELTTLQDRIEREGSVRNFVTRRVRKDGEVLTVSLTRSVLRDSRHRVIGSTAILRDVTELLRTQEELMRSKSLAMVGELVSMIAHEIKNPLAGIYGATQILARGMDGSDPRQETLEGIAQEIRRLDETVKDLLGFTSPTPPKRTPTALRAFVRDTVEWIGMQPDASSYRFETRIDENLLVAVDQKLLGQVVSNLVHNAMQAMTDGGIVTIRAGGTDQELWLEVLDAGTGIADEIRPRLFEPFFTTKSRGSGLGLAIAKKNVESHGGSIEVESALGSGSCFRIQIPSSVLAIPGGVGA